MHHMQSDSNGQEFCLEFSRVDRFFQQDEADFQNAGALGSPYELPANFGLRDLKGNCDTWEDFDAILQEMNKTGVESNTEYLLLYLARHGQSYHNIGEERVGTYIWEHGNQIDKTPICLQPNFKDANLTPFGEDQAKAINLQLHDLVTKHNLPPPQSYHVSPLHRACKTAQLTWAPLQTQNISRFNPTIHEPLREQMYPHNCNQRSSKSQISQSFPSYTFHSSFAEHDNSWSPTHREADGKVTARAHAALTTIISPDFGKRTQNRYISITAHAGLLSGLYRALGIPQSRIPRFPTAIMIPVLIKVQKISGTQSQRQPQIQPHEPNPNQTNSLPTPTSQTQPSDPIPEEWQGCPASDPEAQNKSLRTILDEIWEPTQYEEMIRFARKKPERAVEALAVGVIAK